MCVVYSCMPFSPPPPLHISISYSLVQLGLDLLFSLSLSFSIFHFPDLWSCAALSPLPPLIVWRKTDLPESVVRPADKNNYMESPEVQRRPLLTCRPTTIKRRGKKSDSRIYVRIIIWRIHTSTCNKCNDRHNLMSPLEGWYFSTIMSV